MAQKAKSIAAIVLMPLAIFLGGCREKELKEPLQVRQTVVTSDTLLSGMSESLLPSGFFEVYAILPPGQCPGHYDVKLTDIAKVKKADLVLSFLDMPFMRKAEIDAGRQLVIDPKDRNWMAPYSYTEGLRILAGILSDRFPEHKRHIEAQRERSIREVTEKNNVLSDRIKSAGVSQRTIIASSMLREPLEWMGFRVVGEYGRPESMSAKGIAALIRLGREKKAAMVVDNLQSGPEAGKGIADALDVPHAVLSNFPSEKGYAATLDENVDAVLAAIGKKPSGS